MSGRLEAAIAELVEALREEFRFEAEAGSRTPDRLMSVAEAATVLGVGRTVVYGEIAAGRLRSIRIGRRRLIPRTAIAEFSTRD